MADVNAVVGGYLRDLALAQSSQQKMFGYKRAAAAILWLDRPLTDLVTVDGALPRIRGIGPGSTRVIREILETGASPTVENAIERSEGIEANIDAAGHLDLTEDEAATFEVVLAAPHSKLRKNDDQTDRMLTALQHPAVRILAHPRGRITGLRAGVIADWDAVFEAAARRGVAIEIDGDPARQDLDFTLARQALSFGCVFALDSDAHTTAQLSYAETALAHARLAGIPADRIVNCWPLERLLDWLS